MAGFVHRSRAKATRLLPRLLGRPMPCVLRGMHNSRSPPKRWPTTQPLQVRMAVHTGEAQLRDSANYAGQAIIRTARLRGLGHGGQVLVSNATRDLAVDQLGEEIELRALGEYPLRDLGRPELVWQLVHRGSQDEFAPLTSPVTTAHNLPISLTPFIGRLGEIATLARLVSDERVVTATGSGGAGKTRLA